MPAGGKTMLGIWLSLLPLLCPTEARPQQDPAQAVIRVETVLVNVPVVVTDKKGVHVAGLRVEEFALFDDRVKVPIALFATAEEPLNVALLLDTSLSTRSVLSQIKKHAAEFLKQLRHQYILGFYPDGGKLDGRVHQLWVQVARPGLVVRGRHRYAIDSRFPAH